MNILKKIGWIGLHLLLALFALSFLLVLVIAKLINKMRKPDYMLTVDEQIDKINNEVAMELCWAESYEECDLIIEKGNQKIKALTEKSESETTTAVVIPIGVVQDPLW